MYACPSSAHYLWRMGLTRLKLANYISTRQNPETYLGKVSVNFLQRIKNLVLIRSCEGTRGEVALLFTFDIYILVYI